MPGTSPRNGSNVAVAAAVLLAVVASALLVTAAPGADDAAAREARAGGYGEDRAQAPRAVREWAAAWNEGDAGKMAALFAGDGAYEDHAFGVEFRGRDGIAQWVSITNASIDDAHVEIQHAFRHGDRIAVDLLGQEHGGRPGRAAAHRGVVLRAGRLDLRDGGRGDPAGGGLLQPGRPAAPGGPAGGCLGATPVLLAGRAPASGRRG